MKKKKGFTLVELLVVIAILAILAAVSVVGYLSFTNKAKNSNDETLLTQLNTVLQANEAIENINTISDVVKELEEAGFLIENLTPTNSKNVFIYKEDTNRFILISENDLENNGNFNNWLFISNVEDLNKYTNNYSLYLKDNFDSKEVVVNNGLDVGNNKLDKITYNNGSSNNEVILNTDCKELEINAPNGSVKHYGNSNYVNISNIANNSYHLYGIVTGLKIDNGHIVIEKSGNLFDLLINSTNISINSEYIDKINKYTTNINYKLTINGTKTSVENSKTENEFKNMVINAEISSEYDVIKIGDLYFNDLETAFNYANDQDRIILNEDILLERSAKFTEDKNVILDLNGNKISNENIIYVEANWSLISVRAGSLTITGNGSLIGKENDCYCIDLRDGASCIIENGTFLGNISAVYIYQGKLEIKGGSFKIQQLSSNYNDYRYTINCLDKNYQNDTAIVEISGGIFYEFSPSNNLAEGSNTNFTIEGYITKEVLKDIPGTDIKEKWYEVIKK